eukprot:scaffold3551_cov408-Prasinococcus_capsulatus_cf.AAC.6
MSAISPRSACPEDSWTWRWPCRAKDRTRTAQHRTWGLRDRPSPGARARAGASQADSLEQARAPLATARGPLPS